MNKFGLNDISRIYDRVEGVVDHFGYHCFLVGGAADVVRGLYKTSTAVSVLIGGPGDNKMPLVKKLFVSSSGPGSKRDPNQMCSVILVPKPCKHLPELVMGIPNAKSAPDDLLDTDFVDSWVMTSAVYYNSSLNVNLVIFPGADSLQEVMVSRVKERGFPNLTVAEYWWNERFKSLNHWAQVANSEQRPDTIRQLMCKIRGDNSDLHAIVGIMDFVTGSTSITKDEVMSRLSFATNKVKINEAIGFSK